MALAVMALAVMAPAVMAPAVMAPTVMAPAVMAPAVLPAAWLQDAAGLIAVLALILLGGYAARRAGMAASPATEPGALRLRGRLALDARRRLFLIETPGGAVLVLTGGGQDRMVTLGPEAASPRAA